MKYRPVSGIYCIENLINNKKYIGQTQDIRHRKRNHLSNLDRCADDCDLLQRAWIKYGKESFKFYIIEECSLEILNDREIYWIKELHSHKTEWGYNISWGGDAFMRGRKHSEQTKEKISIGGKGRIVSQKTKDIMSNNLIGNTYAKGRIHPEEERERVSKMFQGKKRGHNTSSSYIGVSYRKDCKKWAADIGFERKRIHIGVFETENDAARAYNIKALELYGENAILNIIEEKIND
jgi:group I intron endonuclease